MIDLTVKPDLEFVQNTQSRLFNIWAQTHSEWETVDSYYHRNYPIWPAVHQGRPSYRPATPTSVIDHAADTQLAFTPSVHREPMGEGDLHKQRADRIEEALKAILDDSALKESVLPFKQIGRYLLGYGYGVIEGPIWNEDMVEKPVKTIPESNEEFKSRMAYWEANRKEFNPIQIRGVHPARVLMDPFNKQPQIAIKQEKMYAVDLCEMSKRKKRTRRTARVFDYDTHDPYKEVVVRNLWTPYWHTVTVEGNQNEYQELWVERNLWGFVPYAHAFAGFGMEPTNMSEINPSYMAQGLLGPIMDSIKNQAQNASAKHNLLIEAAFAPRGTRRDAAEASQALQGDIVQGEPDDWWSMPVKDVTNWMFRVGQEVDADIQEGSYTRTLGGFREVGVSTVGQQAILSTAAQRKFAATAIQLQHLGSIAGRRILQLVDVLDKPISVNGKRLRVSDIDHHYSVTVTFEVIDPVLQLQQREIGMREVQLGIKSKQTYREEDMMVENEQKERQRLLRQQVMETPEVAALLAAEVAKEEGVGEAFARPEGPAGPGVPAGGPPVPPMPMAPGPMGPEGGLPPEGMVPPGMGMGPGPMGPGPMGPGPMGAGEGLPPEILQAILGGQQQPPPQDLGQMRQALTPNTARPRRIRPAPQ
jgi:hypothetical protein